MTHAVQEPELAPELSQRLLALWQRTGDPALRQLAHGEVPSTAPASPSRQARRDWLSTCLMRTFQRTRDPEVFALLYELNRRDFRHAVLLYLRRTGGAIDADDVLQEALLNILRYPQQFRADRADAFRGWAHRIVRNTMLRQRHQGRRHRLQRLDDEGPGEPEDRRTRRPDRATAEHEQGQQVDRAFCLFLAHYLHQYERLPARAQRLLQLAEVEGRCYRDIARELGVAEPQVKVMVFRSRQRIHRGLAAAFDGAAPAAAAQPPAQPSSTSRMPASTSTIAGTSRRTPASRSRKCPHSAAATTSTCPSALT